MCQKTSERRCVGEFSAAGPGRGQLMSSMGLGASQPKNGIASPPTSPKSWLPPPRLISRATKKGSTALPLKWCLIGCAHRGGQTTQTPGGLVLRPPGGVGLLKLSGRAIRPSGRHTLPSPSASLVYNARQGLTKEWIALQPRVGQGWLLFRQCIPTPPSSLRIRYAARLPPTTSNLHYDAAFHTISQPAAGRRWQPPRTARGWLDNSVSRPLLFAIRQRAGPGGVGLPRVPSGALVVPRAASPVLYPQDHPPLGSCSWMFGRSTHARCFRTTSHLALLLRWRGRPRAP